MDARCAVAVATLALIAASATTARAQETEQPSYFKTHMKVPTNALETTVSTGYTQGFGMVAPGAGIGDIAQAGMGVELGLKYRIDPWWAIGINGNYQELHGTTVAAARGVTGGIDVTYHAMPGIRVDPWLQAGVGYRMLWQNNDNPRPNVFTHGFELLKVEVGVDWRVSPAVALGPVIGADLNMFLWQDVAGGGANAMPSATLNTFVWAGLQGRFDINPTYVGAGTGVTEEQAAMR